MRKVTLMGGPFTVAGGDVKVLPERVMGEVTIAPRCIVRVPSGRKSHQEPMPPLEGGSATQWPTGVSVGRLSVCAEARSTGSRAQIMAPPLKAEPFPTVLRRPAPL